MQKHKKNTLTEALSSTKTIGVIVMFIFFSLFLVGTVSAFEFDNVLRYEENDMKVTFTNAFNLPFIGYDIGTAELKSHSSIAEIKSFGFGQEETVMYYDFSGWELYENGLGEVSFTDMKTGKEIQKDYYFVINVSKIEVRNVYGYVLIGDNKTGYFEKQIIKTYEEEVFVWEKLNSKDIPDKSVTIGIRTFVNDGDHIDAVWTIAGKKINRHAEWSGSLAAGLRTYYKMDGTSGVIVDEMNAFDGALTGATRGIDGVVGTQICFDDGDGVNFGNMYPASINAGTLNFWINTTDTGAETGWFVQDGSGQVNDVDIGFGIDTDNWDTCASTDLCWESNGVMTVEFAHATISDGDSHMITVTIDGTTHRLYYDAVSVDNFTSGDNMWGAAGSQDLLISNTLLGSFSCIDELSFSDRAWSIAEIGEAYNGGAGSTINETAIPPTITLDSPVNNTNFTITNNVIMNATIFAATNITNVSLIIDDVYNETNSTSGLNNTVWTFTKDMGEGDFYWTLEACNFNDECTNASQRTFSVDTIHPSINLTFPTATISFHEINNNLSVNWSVSDTNLGTCILEFESVNRTVTCLDNSTEINITNSVNRSLTFYVNDTFGHENSSSRTWDYTIFQNEIAFISSTFETATETFSVNITTNGTAPTNANLVYNGTVNSATITNTEGDNYNISKTIDIPLISGTKTFFFNTTLDSTLIDTSIKEQEVNLTNFNICGGEVPVYINITFKKETVGEEITNATIDSDWNFWLGSGSNFKTLSFTNTTENLDYAFCLIDGVNRTLHTNVSVIYNNFESEGRNFEKSYTLTKDTTAQVLFLLETAEGLFVTFQVINVAEQIISGVEANVTRAGDLIATGTTDDAGLVTFFLDPDTTYTFTFFKEGLDLFTTNLAPTQTSFTIILGTVVPPVETDLTRGISYSIRPIASTLQNGTNIEFNLTLSSDFFSLDAFGFALKNSTGTVFNFTQSTVVTGGFLSQTLNTGDNADIIMELFWTVETNQTNVTRVWKVLDLGDEGYSIKTFFDDLSIYLTSGIFGLSSFGLGIIIFLIIILVTGVLSFKFGITNPAGISIVVFSLVLFFDVGLGLMPNPVNAVPNFPTIFIGVVFLGTLFAEAIK